MKHKAVLLWSLLGVVGLAMFAGIVAVVLPSRYVDDRVFATISIMGIYALGGLVLVAVSGRRRWTLRISSLCLVSSMLIYIAAVWLERMLNWQWEQFFWKTGTIVLIIGLIFAHRLMLSPLRTPLMIASVVKRTALISGVLLGGIIIFGLINDGFWDWDELFVRLMGIAAIIMAGTTIATGAFAIFAPKPGEDEPGLLVGSIPVSLTCPRCNAAVSVQSNREGRCEGCRLKVRVEIEEPRCSCGYLLYELESDTCPECGKPIPEEDRWKTA
ncbi:MAG: hypothetical protein KC996_01455 [Phycisphaerales bacterium]|nr:hypothetical protein [Phycisphaerales bacterium]